MVLTPLSARPSAKRFLLVVNPVAGKNGFSIANAVIAAMRAHGVSPEVYHTRGAGDATDYLRTRAAGGLEKTVDVVVAAGGDGTVNEVINGIAGHDVALGLIPCGTTNVLATELGYPGRIKDIARVLVAGHEQVVHFSTVNGRRFSMMTGIGYDAWVVAGVNHGIKQKFGKLAYVLSMLQQLKQFGSRTYRVTIDGKAHEAMSMVITKGRHYAGSYTLTHQADITQPSLQVILVQTGSATRFLGMLLMLPLGLVEKLSFIRSVSGRDIRVEVIAGPDVDPIQADGDTVSQMPAEIRVEDVQTRVLVP